MQIHSPPSPRRATLTVRHARGTSAALRLFSLAGILIASFLVSAPVNAEGQVASPASAELTAAARNAVIESVLNRIKDSYVLPDVSTQIVAAVRRRQESQAYEGITSASELSRVLTADLRSVNHDPHLLLVYHAKPAAPYSGPREQSMAEVTQRRYAARLNNFGFEQVGRMGCNVGYLDLRRFDDPDDASVTAAAAMQLLANTDALIIDLRENGGGAPAMGALLATYLFGSAQVQLENVYTRSAGLTRQFWTLPSVRGPRYLRKEVYILTSSRTFSEAEAFAYELQALKRATVVGERTAGGAHITQMAQIDAYFDLWVPTARCVNPITGTNWEGVGVAPDLEVPATQALIQAYLLALRQLQSRNTDVELAGEYQKSINAALLGLQQLKASEPPVGNGR